jgi:4-amino-4-deoxy-L-arabinose transferase-like glycosyltransferase
MFTIAQKWGSRIWLALIWSLVTQVLLSLPGSVFPGGGLFSIPHLDKLVHIFIFGGLVFCWTLFFYFKNDPPSVSLTVSWVIVLMVFMYGIVMEFVQKNFIPQRSFDGGDIIADLAGSLIGYILTQWLFRWHNRGGT